MAKKTTLKYYEAIGRRKSSIAQVRLYIAASSKEVSVGDLKIKRGDIAINKKPAHEYLPGEIYKAVYMRPFILTDASDRFAVSVHVTGGGSRGQLDAIVLGCARALEKADKDFRPRLKKEGLLTRDSRIKERRKVGTGGKARRKKQSPKR